MTKGPKKSKKKRPSKKDKLFENLLMVTEQFMRGRSFVSLTEEEIMDKLDIPDQYRSLLRKVLDALIKQGVTKRSKGKYVSSRSSDEIVTGIISVHARGFGFVKPDNPAQYNQDIFIPKHLTQNAVQGDHVEVVVNPRSVSEKGPEGKVIAILKRGRTHIAGIIRSIEWQGDILAYAPMLGMSQRIVVAPSEDHPLQIGDRIVMEVTDWGDRETETYCRMSHYIGHITDPSVDIKAAIEEYELRADFPDQVIKEASNHSKKVPLEEIKKRDDFRELECVTIDPDTARDFDDALTLTKDASGYHLGVHIADVSHYVLSDSPLDKEALMRSNSTYFPGFCIPMLPQELSNELCSLKPNVNRLTVSVMMNFDEYGELIDYKVHRSVIKSAKRFTYKEAKQVLDGNKKSPHTDLLKRMVELCGLLKNNKINTAKQNCDAVTCEKCFVGTLPD